MLKNFIVPLSFLLLQCEPFYIFLNTWVYPSNPYQTQSNIIKHAKSLWTYHSNWNTGCTKIGWLWLASNFTESTYWCGTSPIWNFWIPAAGLFSEMPIVFWLLSKIELYGVSLNSWGSVPKQSNSHRWESEKVLGNLRTCESVKTALLGSVWTHKSSTLCSFVDIHA